ncbi:MAG: hypothetical protein OXG56_11125 [Gammaproteobacteria bacterium]|nr:hypothetical protein [Gammaproteobacteria bacterium]
MQKNRLFPANLVAGIILAAGLSGTAPVGAQESGALARDTFYYQIGGHRASRAPTSYSRSVVIGGSASISSNLSCGSFDLDNNLKRLFENISSGADRAVDALVYAAQGAVASLPFYVLRRADPNLANMLENAMARYEDYIKLSVRSCREAQRMIQEGKNPYADWIKVGTSGAWKAGAEAASADGSLTVTEQHEEILDGEGLCIRWIDDEKRACEEGPPIQVIREVTERGHVLTTESTGTPNGDIGRSDARLASVFPEPSDASAWLVQVLGDLTIDNRPGGVPSGTPGYGVGASLSETAEQYILDLTRVVDANALEEAGSDELSIPGVEINPTLIRALQRQPEAVRRRMISKIGTEMALLKTMERINIARDLLLTGSRDPHVINTPAFASINEIYLPLLKAEYELLKDQYEAKDYMARSTMARILEEYAREQRRIPGRSGTEVGTGRIENGAFIE